MDIFQLFGKIIIENSDAEKTLERTKTIAKGVGSALATTTKLVGAAVVAGSTAVAGFVGKSVSAFAEYEQLVGGVETLFGAGGKNIKDYAASVGKSIQDIQSEYHRLMKAEQTVMNNANNAFKTAGLSANEYMETVTSFSAALIQSLGGDTAKAANYADKAITDMSDNANKMGSSMESIQTAYAGFAKQNYTMLDNLKLGYGGTKEEMERLIRDAEKLDESFSVTHKKSKKGIDEITYSYADVVDAIHIVQTNMGITGTTAKEAEATISGSIAMTKSAWQNLVSGLAQDNANIPQLVNNVVTSGVQVLKNIIPVAKRVLQNLPAAISEISPKAGAAFQKIVDICTVAFETITGAIEPTLRVIRDVFSYVKENTWVLTAAATAIGIITTAIGMYNAVAAVKAAMAAAEVTTVWALVAAYAAQAVAMLAAIAPYLAVAAAIAAVIAIGVALYQNWDVVKEKCAQLGEFLSEKWNSMKENISNRVEEMKAAATTKFEEIRSAASEKFESMKASVSLAVSNAKETATTAFNNIKSGISNAVSSALTTVQNKFNAIKQSISDRLQEAWGVVQEVIAKIKSAFDFDLKLNIKLPKISVSGGEAPYGIGGKGKMPSFSVTWFKKAMDNAMVLSDPTIFGYSNGKMLGAGEAGNEVVAGEAHLMNLIGQVVESKTAAQNARIIDLLTALLDAMVGGNEEMIQALMSDRTFTVGEREFARLVRTYA